MFWRKNEVKDDGFTATLSLPKYIPKDRLLGRVVFDYDLERIGQAVNWTYTPEGQISLIVSGDDLKERLKGDDTVLIPFRYIDRAGRVILLSEPIDTLLSRDPISKDEDWREKAIAALEAEFEEEEEPRELEREPRPKKRSTRSKKRRQPKKELKAFDELKEELFEEIVAVPMK